MDGKGGPLSSREIYDGRIVKLSVDRVRFPDGSTGELELIRHPGAAAVLPVLGSLEEEDPEILLVRQYRYAAGGYLLEVPAGIPDDPEESWEECARRELEEETGWRAGSLEGLTQVHTTPGFTDEVIHLFVASRLTEGRRARDPDEFMEVISMPFSRAVDRVRTGGVTDAKSVATLLYARCFLALGGG